MPLRNVAASKMHVDYEVGWNKKKDEQIWPRNKEEKRTLRLGIVAFPVTVVEIANIFQSQEPYGVLLIHVYCWETTAAPWELEKCRRSAKTRRTCRISASYTECPINSYLCSFDKDFLFLDFKS
jgi:hypothetical protein